MKVKNFLYILNLVTNGLLKVPHNETAEFQELKIILDIQNFGSKAADFLHDRIDIFQKNENKLSYQTILLRPFRH
jgi:hypothetical protein